MVTQILAQTNSGDATVGIVLVLILIGVYFLPTIIAGTRVHRNTVGVFLLNLFLGWTLLGWVGALIWSVYKGRD